MSRQIIPTWLVISIIVIGFGVAGRMDYEEEVRKEMARVEWVKARCLDLAKKESAWVNKRPDGSIACAKYKGANLAFAGVSK